MNNIGSNVTALLWSKIQLVSDFRKERCSSNGSLREYHFQCCSCCWLLPAIMLLFLYSLIFQFFTYTFILHFFIHLYFIQLKKHIKSLQKQQKLNVEWFCYSLDTPVWNCHSLHNDAEFQINKHILWKVKSDIVTNKIKTLLKG